MFLAYQFRSKILLVSYWCPWTVILWKLHTLNVYVGGTQKFLVLLNKNYLKYLYKSETLVPFEVLPLRLDAAIPAPLPMLETSSKISNANAVKSRQRNR
jgi:hypothetical protein